MHPVLLTLGEFEVSSYAFFYSVSFVVMFVLAVVRAPRFQVEHDTLLNVSILFGLGMLLGSRGWYLFLNREQFAGNWAAAFNPFRQGFAGWNGSASTGGVMLGVLMVLAYTRFAKHRFLAIADAGAPGFLLTVAIARTGGCFLTGCCFGKPTDSVLGVVFPPEGHLGPFPLGTPLWPTQLFSGVLGVSGFLLVVWLERRFTFCGASFAMTAGYYALDRFLVEQFRYYPPAEILGTLGPLTFNFNHLLLGGLFAASLLLWLRGKYRADSAQEKGEA